MPPASVITCTRGGTHIERYWRLSFRDKIVCTESEAIERLDPLLEDATRLRMISDVPLGTFLSGGVDSSTVVALMSCVGGPVRTFTVGFEDKSFDELPHARLVARALGTNHLEIPIEADAAAVLLRLVWHHGEPFADSSAVPTFYVSAAAREHVKVVLNGDGGDESFAGYSWNRAIRVADLYQRLVPRLVRRGVLAPLGSVLARMAASDGPVRSVSRLLADWSERSAADVFWIWPGFEAAGLEHLYAPSFRSRLVDCDPAAYCRAKY